MHTTGREGWKRIASLVLVAVIATFSLPVGASALTRAVDAPPVQRAHAKRLQPAARAVTARRTLRERELTVSDRPLLVVALALVGLLLWAVAVRPHVVPALLPASRGPPSPALDRSVLR